MAETTDNDAAALTAKRRINLAKARAAKAERASRVGFPPEWPEAKRDGVVYGRNGEVLTRSRVAGVDPFAIPPEIIPPGWVYQWNVVTVTGNADLVMDQGMQMHENGWRAVPGDRHPGRFVPLGHTGAIIRGGMRLEERPKALNDQAAKEEYALAKQQMLDRDQSLMGGKANLRGSVSSEITDRTRYRGAGADLRMSIDPGLDVPTPTHKLAE